MDKKRETEIEISEEFKEDLGKLLKFCLEANTDNLEIEFNIGGGVLIADISFRVEVDRKELLK